MMSEAKMTIANIFLFSNHDFEGIGTAMNLHPLQRALIEEAGVQCGICTPGMIMAGLDLLQRNPDPTRDEIVEGIAGNLCRCTGYQKIITAIQRAARETV